MTMIDHAERARALFEEGYNCAQAVFCAFTDETGMDFDAAARLASSFGGGLGRLREVCGAVSGAAMVLGCTKGYADPKDAEAKKAHYARVRDFADRFKAEEGTIICRELLERGGRGGVREARRRPRGPHPAILRRPPLSPAGVARREDRGGDAGGIKIKRPARRYRAGRSFYRLSTFSGYRSCWLRRCQATSSHRVPGLP